MDTLFISRFQYNHVVGLFSWIPIYTPYISWILVGTWRLQYYWLLVEWLTSYYTNYTIQTAAGGLSIRHKGAEPVDEIRPRIPKNIFGGDNYNVVQKTTRWGNDVRIDTFQSAIVLQEVFADEDLSYVEPTMKLKDVRSKNISNMLLICPIILLNYIISIITWKVSHFSFFVVVENRVYKRDALGGGNINCIVWLQPLIELVNYLIIAQKLFWTSRGLITR